MGHKDLSDEDLARTHHGLYEKPQLDQQNQIAEKGLKVQAATKATQLKTKAAAKAKVGSKPKTSSSNKKDSVKRSKSNSNITKSHRDSMENISIQDEFRAAIESISTADKTRRKLDILVATKCVYDLIKDGMVDHALRGMQDAARDLGVEDYSTNIVHDIFGPVDKLRDSVVDMVHKDPNSLNRAAARVSIANRTEQCRAYNYGYAITCVNNSKNTLLVYTDAENTDSDSTIHIGKEIEVNRTNILAVIPPYRPNSRLKIKLKEED
jgi:hypothetical protein